MRQLSCLMVLGLLFHMSFTALIVEDDKALANIFAMVMQKLDIETVAFYQGDQALAWLAEQCPDLLILDLHVPIVSGFTILEHLRASPQGKQVPVIVTTADVLTVDTIRDHVDAVLTKPFSPRELIAVTQALLTEKNP